MEVQKTVNQNNPEQYLLTLSLNSIFTGTDKCNITLNFREYFLKVIGLPY